MVEYYDYILLAIPLVTCVTAGSLLLVGVSSHIAIAMGGAASNGLVIYALFSTLPHQTGQDSTSVGRQETGGKI